MILALYCMNLERTGTGTQTGHEGKRMLVLVGGEKGGVGKTTLTLNLAAMRARRQGRVARRC
jgi:Mrp family chromosome partitioning ATPase